MGLLGGGKNNKLPVANQEQLKKIMQVKGRDRAKVAKDMGVRLPAATPDQMRYLAKAKNPTQYAYRLNSLGVTEPSIIELRQNSGIDSPRRQGLYREENNPHVLRMQEEQRRTGRKSW